MPEEDEPAEEEESRAEEEVEPALVEPPTVEDEEDFEDLSNLSVPSWAELVAGLYRPPDR